MMRKIIRGLFILAIMLLGLESEYFSVQAEAKEYTIKSIDYEVELQENGDARIFETWEVRYKGEYSRLYRDFHVGDLNAVEAFTDIEINEVTIEDMICEYTEDLDAREDATYSLEDLGEDIRLSWYQYAEDESVTYTVDYTLKDVVKETDNGQAAFCYRFLGKDFEKEVEEVSIWVNTFSYIPMELDYFNQEEDWEIEEYEDSLYLTNYEPSIGLIKLNVIMESDAFDELDYVSGADIQNLDDEDDLEGEFFGKVMLISIGALLLGILWLLIVVIMKSAKNAKYEKIMREQSNYIYEAIDSFIRISPNPLIAGSLYGKRKEYKDVRIMLLYLHSINVMMINDSSIIIYKNRLCNLTSKEYDFVQKLLSITKFVEADDTYAIGEELLSELTKEKIEKLVKCTKSITKELHALAVKKENSRKLKHLKEKACFIAWYTKKYCSWISETGTREVLCKDCDFRTLVMMVCSKETWKTTEDVSENTNLWLNNFDMTIIGLCRSSSDSSGGGCSSCSSCSGCGGGGAD